jgi:hypothetical protein
LLKSRRNMNQMRTKRDEKIGKGQDKRIKVGKKR